MANEPIRPLISESSTSESTTVDVVLSDMRDKTVTIPDYQRDGDQWEEPTKSLLIESVINNLTIPAFFFETFKEEEIEKNAVVDGQQRLSTLFEFHQNKLRLVSSDEAPYLSPSSVHYAGKTYDELPASFQQTFKKYRLTIIKLRDLGDMRLEVFRRINQGGTPLSAQDIRLAYYGDGSSAVAFIRLAGIYDAERPAAKRFIETASGKYGISFPWENHLGLETWRDWWEGKEIAKGQTASEMFLWSLVAAQVDKLNSLLENAEALARINCRFKRAVDEALDAYCAQLKYQAANPDSERLLMETNELRERFFPHFGEWIEFLLGQKGISIQVPKNRLVAALIGAAYDANVRASSLSDQQWTNVVEFVRRPQDVARRLAFEWPVSKGRWDGKKGYRAQLQAARDAIGKLCG